MNFVQIITVQSDDPDTIVELAAKWDAMQAEDEVSGYAGSRVLRDRERPGRYLVIAEFGQVDPAVPAADEAARNNDRPITQEWAERMRAICDGEPDWGNFDEIYRTG